MSVKWCSGLNSEHFIYQKKKLYLYYYLFYITYNVHTMIYMCIQFIAKIFLINYTQAFYLILYIFRVTKHLIIKNNILFVFFDSLRNYLKTFFFIN